MNHCDMECPDKMTSIYQGENLTITLESKEEGNSLTKYEPRAVLVYDSPKRTVVLRWDKINVSEDGIAVFEITGEQSKGLIAGIYMLEVSLVEKDSGHEIKTQLRSLLEVKLSYTV